MTTAGNGGIIKEQYNSRGDPVREIWGPGEQSHPEQIKEFREEIKRLGVELIESENEKLGYSPAIKSGSPGTIYISKGASYGAWAHEMQHMRDDFADGWGGFRILQNIEERYAREVKAYQIEIDMANQANRPDIVAALLKNLEKERENIYGL